MSDGPAGTPVPSVYALVIGNEILTAKVRDDNGPHLIARLRARGIPLAGLHVVPDDTGAIVEALQAARARAGFVVTSGGIGPTHDDVTVRAVARALGRPVVRSAQLVSLVQQHYTDAVTDEALRLADVPEGTLLLEDAGGRFPVLGCEGVYMLPGVPFLFRRQLERVLRDVSGRPVVLRVLYLALGESSLAAALDRVVAAHPDVGIGSYPTFESGADHRVKITFEHTDAAQVEGAAVALERELPAGSVVRRASWGADAPWSL